VVRREAGETAAGSAARREAVDVDAADRALRQLGKVRPRPAPSPAAARLPRRCHLFTAAAAAASRRWWSYWRSG
jgi:hypothetical protein